MVADVEPQDVPNVSDRDKESGVRLTQHRLTSVT